MQLKLYIVQGIEDYFFYKINPLDDELKEISNKYPKGIQEFKSITINYDYNDIFIENILEPRLMKMVANNIFFKSDSLNKFIDVINEFNKEVLNLNQFLFKSIDELNTDKYKSNIFSKDLKLNLDVIKNMDKYFDKKLNYFIFKKDDLDNCITKNIISKYDNFKLYINFNNESYIQKI
jgi:hypothetical protein